MPDLWYAIAAATLTAYVVLDGFDFGAGVLHRRVARTPEERRQVLAAIGPFWDGNEVWLLVTGGVLFVAFPRALAVGLSGFYFAIFLVLWSLILRGLAIEFRSHHTNPLWRSAWDTVFTIASGALAVLFGVALGNLIRGLPIDASGWFSLALFTDFTARPPVGILDVYTVLVGAFAWTSLVAHGGAFLAWRTDGAVSRRALGVTARFTVATAVLWPLVTWATVRVNPSLFQAFGARPAAWIAPAIAWGGLGLAFGASRRGRGGAAFLGSSTFLAGMLAATAACLWPTLLRAVPDGARSITAADAAAPSTSLRIAAAWALPGLALAVSYLAFLFRLHRGPAVAAKEGEGY